MSAKKAPPPEMIARAAELADVAAQSAKIVKIKEELRLLRLSCGAKIAELNREREHLAVICEAAQTDGLFGSAPLPAAKIAT